MVDLSTNHDPKGSGTGLHRDLKFMIEIGRKQHPNNFFLKNSKAIICRIIIEKKLFTFV